MNDEKELFFYFDYISPYAYLAWKKITRLAERYSVKLKPEPVLFGVILDNIDTKGPAEIPSKREFVFKDVLRWAAKRNIPLNFPPAHPFNPLPALRSTCVMENNPRYFEFINTLFDKCWKDGLDISNTELISSIMHDFGVDNGLEQINNSEIKNILKEKTNNALSRGIFGVPSMCVDNEIFWGNDRLEFLENYLRGEDVIDKDKLNEILSRPKAVERKQANKYGFLM